jgi:hypothetical protein
VIQAPVDVIPVFLLHHLSNLDEREDFVITEHLSGIRTSFRLLYHASFICPLFVGSVTLFLKHPSLSHGRRERSESILQTAFWSFPISNPS